MEDTTPEVTPLTITYPMGIETSRSIKQLATALAKFQGAVESVPKDAENPYFHSKYATLDAIFKTIKKPLADNGLSFTQMPAADRLVTILMHSSGEFIMSSYALNAKDKTAQSVGSAITYARRYAIGAVLGIATESDDDGNAATGKTEKTAKKTRDQVESFPPFGEGSEEAIID